MTTEGELRTDVTAGLAPRSTRVARTLALLAAAALATWLGVRIRDAMGARATVRAQAEEQARRAQPTGGAPRATIRGAPRSWEPVVPIEGTLAPAQEADLGFSLGGKLGAVLVRVGDTVAPGAVLGQLRTEDAAAAVAAARAQVKAAEAQLALADDARARTQAVVDAGAASEASGVTAEHQRALAAAQLDGARASLEMAELRLRDHALHALFGGTVTRVPSGVGQVVGPGVPVFHLADTATLKLAATVGEADAALVRPGLAVEIADGDHLVTGKITAVLSTLDPATRRVPVEAIVQNDAKAPVRAGAFVRARVRGGASVPVLELPPTALRPGSQDEVMVVAGGKLVARHVAFTTGPDGAIYVRAGLAPTDDVLKAPSPEAKDGDVVVATAEGARP